MQTSWSLEGQSDRLNLNVVYIPPSQRTLNKSKDAAQQIKQLKALLDPALTLLQDPGRRHYGLAVPPSNPTPRKRIIGPEI